jgi:hypothetical protein
MSAEVEETASSIKEEKSKKKWLLLGLPVLLILLLTIIAGAYLFQSYRFKQPQVQTQPLLSPITEEVLVLEISPIESGKLPDWQTYANPKAGFSLKYPPHQVLGISTECNVDLSDYPKEITDNFSERVVIIPGEPCSQGFIVKLLANPSNLPPLEFWQNILGSVRCNAGQTECYRDYKYQGKEDRTAIYLVQKVKIAGREGIKIVAKETAGEAWGEDIYLPGDEGQLILIQFQPSTINDQILATLQFTNP